MFLPLVALASNDPLSTEQYVEPGDFPQTADMSRCDREKIGRPLTLADVVDLTLCNNPQTRLLWANARAQAANVGVGMSAYLPTLSAQASDTRYISNAAGSAGNYRSRNANLSAGYLLFDFGGRSGTLENAKQLLVAANATRDATLQANFLGAVQAYYALLSAQASVDALKVAEASARESFSAAEARYRAGIATPADKLQAQTALSQARLNLITAQGTTRTAQGTLANVMGFDASIQFTLVSLPELVPDPAVEQDIGKLIDDARRKRPDLRAAEAQIKAAEAQLEVSRAAGLPSVSLNASTGSQNLPGVPITNTSNIGVTLNVPLFTGGSNTYQNRAAELQIEGKVAARDILANQIALDVWKAYQALLTNSQTLIASNDLVASAEQSERMTLGRYKAGVANMSILDVLNAQSTLASARQQHVAALYNFQASRLALAQAIGQLDLTRLEAGN
ncbi:outer membrane protein OprM precursor [mine drainage metagenome]|uniref:Outer membrane protein OprM n=1 Tax=mine drainage metagenome TaxID=410659 RepID=A0A1J5RDH9_9ZZZZ